MVTRTRTAAFPLAAGEIRRRAGQIALVLTDNDGVLTDTGVYYSDAGEMLKRYSVRDGMGMQLLHESGIETGIVSAETSGNLRRRAEKLRVCRLYLGIKDKRSSLAQILRETGLELHQLAYIGDDVNDAGILEAIGTAGLTGAPADAVPSIRRLAHHVCMSPGGHGAFREFADWILNERGRSAASVRTRKRADGM